MNKVSSKLAASVRKVKAQESRPDAVQSAVRETVAHSMEKKLKPSLEPKHPKRVWPD